MIGYHPKNKVFPPTLYISYHAPTPPTNTPFNCADAIESIIALGVDVTMNKFNSL